MVITSEAQLDDTGLDALYLLHVLVDAQRGAGESLPNRVNGLRTALAENDPTAADLFDDRLFEAGYLETHNPLQRYREPGYTLRRAHLYHVREGFPRIITTQLPSGIGRVTYHVAATACTAFEEAVPTFSEQLREKEGAP
jgi:hypothetical protein